jgi:CheY-like chemotaxis protein
MADKRNVKVLFIEDENLLRSLFSELFTIDKEYSYETLSAMDLKSGLERLKTDRPDIIVLDLILPYDKSATKDKGDLSEKMGLAFLKEAKSDKQYQNIPVIVFSNLNDLETKKSAYEAGAYAYLIKASTTPEQFITVLKEALKKTIK